LKNGLTPPLVELLIGQVVLAERDEFSEIDLPFLEKVSQHEDFVDDHRGSGDRAGHRHLSPFDAFSYLDFAFPGQQGDCSHLPEIHPHGIIRLVQYPRSQI
jgi:hypothetical protein